MQTEIDKKKEKKNAILKKKNEILNVKYWRKLKATEIEKQFNQHVAQAKNLNFRLPSFNHSSELESLPDSKYWNRKQKLKLKLTT